MHNQILRILPLLLLNLSAYAGDDCSSVDVLENVRKNGSPELKAYFANPLQQDGVGWCYAYSAAQMLSFHTGKPVSAIHLASSYNRSAHPDIQGPRTPSTRSSLGRLWDFMVRKKDKANISEFGLSGDAIDAAKEEGFVCTESALPSNLNLFSPSRGTDGWQFRADVAALRELQRTAEEERETRGSLAHFFSDRRMTSAYCSQLSGSLLALFNKLSEGEIKQIVGASAWQGLDETIARLIAANCKNNRVDISKFEFVDNVIDPRKRPGQKLMPELDAALSQGKPVNISYETNRLHAVPKAGENHMSLVVGRKMIDGVCHYEVRNTWGKNGCGTLSHPNLKCDSRNGHYFVPKELLATALYGVTYAK